MPQKTSCVLEEFSLAVENERKEFFEIFAPNFYFSRLKTLMLHGRSCTQNAEFTKLTKALVARAPNLQVLCTDESVNLKANLLEGSSAMHLTSFSYFPSLDDILENSVGQLRMQTMALAHTDADSSSKRLNRITPTILETSRTTYSSMKVGAMFLVPLMYYGICLDNVKELDVAMGPGKLELFSPRILRLVKSFDFTRIFPNINEVTFSYSNRFITIPDEFNEMIEQDCAMLREPMPDRAINIKSLSLGRIASVLVDTSAEFLGEMFPSIQKLSIYGGIRFGRIRDAWLDLKELEVTMRNFEFTYIDIDLDRILCGMYPQEVADLRGKDDEYLRALNIVPVFPSITCPKGLRTFNLYYRLPDEFKGNIGAQVLCSKLTGIIAFERCPLLTVTIGTNNTVLHQALSHMKPFASIVRRDPTD